MRGQLHCTPTDILKDRSHCHAHTELRRLHSPEPMECTAEKAHSDMVPLARMIAPAALIDAICMQIAVGY